MSFPTHSNLWTAVEPVAAGDNKCLPASDCGTHFEGAYQRNNSMWQSMSQLQTSILTQPEMRPLCHLNRKFCARHQTCQTTCPAEGTKYRHINTVEVTCSFCWHVWKHPTNKKRQTIPSTQHVASLGHYVSSPAPALRLGRKYSC